MRKTLVLVLTAVLLVLWCIPAFASFADPYVDIYVGDNHYSLLFPIGLGGSNVFALSEHGGSGTLATTFEDGQFVLTLDNAVWKSGSDVAALFVHDCSFIRLVGDSQITWNAADDYNGALQHDDPLTIEGEGTLTFLGNTPFAYGKVTLQNGAKVKASVTSGSAGVVLDSLTLNQAEFSLTDSLDLLFSVNSLTLDQSTLNVSRAKAEYGLYASEVRVTDSSMNLKGISAGLYVDNGPSLTITHLNEDDVLLCTSTSNSSDDNGGIVMNGFNTDPQYSQGNAIIAEPKNGKLRASTIELPPSPNVASAVVPNAATDVRHILSFSADGKKNAKVVRLVGSLTSPTIEAPRTGDATPLTLWAILMLVAVFGLAPICFKPRRP